MVQNRLFAIIFRGACFVCILVGLLAQMGLFKGSFSVSSLMYYTILSNILAVVLFGLLFYKSVKEFRLKGTHGDVGYFPRFEMVCVIDLLLTLLVYWVLLAPGAFSMGTGSELFSFSNLSVHMLSPLFCLIDYLLFTKSKQLKYRDVYAVLIFPLSYVAFTSIAGFMGYVYRVDLTGREVHFPYFFFDWDQIGLMGFVYIAALAVFFLILSHVLYLLDQKWEKPVFGNK